MADAGPLSLADVAPSVGRYDVVNIKLDKCGGLTEGLLMAQEARRLGMDVLVSTSTLLAYFASVFETVRGGDTGARVSSGPAGGRSSSP